MKANENKRRTHKKTWLIILASAIAVLCITFLIYAEQYYHAEESALTALKSDDSVIVTQREYGWFFNGPSETDALIFYPGGKVEETAYAPLLHRLAEQGMDVCLVRMPFRLAILGINKADQVMVQHDYEHWYIGGHSLGGAMAASYASNHNAQLSGVFMLAAYPTKPLAENMKALIIYGSEDGVLNLSKLEETIRNLPGSGKVYVIEGGNHAQFGNYGTQAGDGHAVISSEEQQQRTVEWILMTKQTASGQTDR